jgi:hypothetical protein
MDETIKRWLMLLLLLATDAFNPFDRGYGADGRPRHGFYGFGGAEGLLFLLFRHGKGDLNISHAGKQQNSPRKNDPCV